MKQDIFDDGIIFEFVDPSGTFRDKLSKKINGSYDKDIIIKFGVDPTRPDIHLGHAVIFRFLRKMQDLGCRVVFLVGDFTARIGDPTGKSKVRPEIDQAEIEHNMNTYLDQVGKVLSTDSKVFSWIRNSDWFVGISDIFGEEGSMVKLPEPLVGEVPSNTFIGKSILYENSRMQRTHLGKQGVVGITLSTFLWTLKKITHQNLIDRDMFQGRIQNGEELYMHEMMYPVLQGIDSFVLHQIYGSCDLEIGGTDQTFNMLLGREVMKFNSVEPQSVISMKLLRGTDGKEKMSKSLSNYISINDTASDIFGKVMSIPDDLMAEYFELCTDMTKEEIEAVKSQINKKENLKSIKMDLASKIVEIYHGNLAASSAFSMFENVFSNGDFPEDAVVLEVGVGEKLIDILVANNMVESKSEARRLIEAGALSEYPDKKILDTAVVVEEGEKKFRLGKKTFFIVRSK